MRLDFALQLPGVGKGIAVHFFAHRIQNLARRLHAKVRGEQRRLQTLQEGRIDLALAQKNGINRFRKHRLRFADGLLQPLKKGRLRLILPKK